MTKRVDVHYDGVLYTLPGDQLDAVRERVLTAVDGGEAFWLEVNIGEGRYQRADLLVSPGVPISLVAITEE